MFPWFKVGCFLFLIYIFSLKLSKAENSTLEQVIVLQQPQGF